MNWLFSLYLGATVFGAGVLIIDLLGLLGHEAAQGSTDLDTSDADTALADTSGAATDADADVTADTSQEGSTDDAEGNTGNSSDGEPAQIDGAGAHVLSHPAPHAVSAVMHDRPVKGNAALKALSVLRSFVYFSAGFGPVGLFAHFSRMSALSSLLWSIPTGLAAVGIARLLMRLFKKEVDSSVKEHELLMEHGVVTVSIGKGELGKVRISLGGMYVDRYARAKEADASIPLGSKIYVCDIDEDCLIVEKEGE